MANMRSSSCSFCVSTFTRVKCQNQLDQISFYLVLKVATDYVLSSRLHAHIRSLACNEFYPFTLDVLTFIDVV